MMTKLKLFLENGTRKLHPDCLKGMTRDHYKKIIHAVMKSGVMMMMGLFNIRLMRILWQALFFGLLWKAQLWITRYC